MPERLLNENGTKEAAQGMDAAHHLLFLQDDCKLCIPTLDSVMTSPCADHYTDASMC